MSNMIEDRQTDIQNWFDDFVATLRSHQIQLETETASKELREFYNPLFSGNPDQIISMNKEMIQKYYVEKIIVDYLHSIQNCFPSKLAFDFNDSEVLVWAEIDGDIEKMERNLILIEAKINSKYHSQGFDMSTIIVESSDKLPIPNHYKIFKS